MTHEHSTACPMDCPDACSLTAVVGGEKLVALKGSSTNPFTAGFMCSKMQRYPERVHGPDRLLHPLIRTGPKGSKSFRQATWDEALDLVVRRISSIRQEHGNGSILPYHYDGSNGVFAAGMVDDALWRSLGVCDPIKTLCAAPASGAATAIYGKMPGTDPTDLTHSKVIVLWGQNPRVSNIHLVPHLNAALDRGAKLVVLDPRKTGMAKRAHLYVPLWPGSDLAIALALIAECERRGLVATDFLARHTRNSELLLAAARPWSLERAAKAARVPVETLKALADIYLGAERPVMTRVGWGLERNKNGDGAMAAILALPAICGHFGVRGGGYLLSQSGAWRVASNELAMVPDSPRRQVNISQLATALRPDAKEPIQSLIVYDANPMVSTPDQEGVRRGLERDDLFTVVLEQVMTDTCDYADVILPVPTFVEQHEMHRAYGTSILQRLTPAIPVVGEGRPNEVIFSELAKRFGFEGPAFDPSPQALEARWLKAVKGAGPDDLDRLRATGSATLTSPTGRPPVAFVDVYPYTPDEKADLHPDAWRSRGIDVFTFGDDPSLPDTPFAVLSPASDSTINSILGELNDRTLPCHVSPTDAKHLAITEGDLVRLSNKTGSLVARATIDLDLRQGVLVVPKGVWLRNGPARATANALVSEAVTPATGGATYNDARVRLERLDP